MEALFLYILIVNAGIILLPGGCVSSGVGPSMAVKAIMLPSGDHLKLLTPVETSVTCWTFPQAGASTRCYCSTRRQWLDHPETIADRRQDFRQWSIAWVGYHPNRQYKPGTDNCFSRSHHSVHDRKGNAFPIRRYIDTRYSLQVDRILW